MHILSFIFTILRISGIWRPIKWSSGWKKIVYWLYTTIVIVSVYIFCVSETIYALQCGDDLEEMANSLFMPLTMACAVCKAGNIINRRQDIIRFMNILKNDNCKPNCADEVRALQEYDRQIKQTTLWYLTVVGTSVGSYSTTSLFIDIPRRTLPFSAWIPFNYTTPIGFWSAYLHQIFAHGLGAVIGTGYDIFLCCLISQACGNLKVLQYRLQFMTRTIVGQTHDEKKLNHEDNPQEVENRFLTRCIDQHRDIFRYADSINETFNIVIFMQCAVSTFVLCTSIYTLSTMKKSGTEFFFIFTYTFAMVTQIFIYCWYGNQIILESKDVGNAVYAMDWPKLSVRTQKNLQLVMVRSLEPITVTTGNILVLSLDTFIGLLKLSYSTFNLLQQTSEK